MKFLRTILCILAFAGAARAQTAALAINPNTGLIKGPVDAATFASVNGFLTTSSSGTVSSVGLSMPNLFTVTGSPVTTSGTLTAVLANQSANTVFAGPTTGAAAAPGFRALVAADIPAISLTAGISGILPIANGGTNASSIQGAGQSLGIPYNDVQAKSANFTVAVADKGKLFSVTTAASTITATLPAAATAGDGWYVILRKVDAGAGVVATSPATVGLAVNGHTVVVYTDGTSYFERTYFGGMDTAGKITISTGNAQNLALNPAGSLTINGGTLAIANAKTFTVSNTLTLAGTDGTTLTFPTTSATIARTDAGQTFTGSNVIGGITFNANAATAFNSLTSASATDLTLTGNAGASLVLGNGAGGNLTLTPKGGGTGKWVVSDGGFGGTWAVLSSGTPSSANYSIASDGSSTTIFNSPGTTLPIDFRLGNSQTARLSGTNGNLLVGGTTDISGSGGLKVFGSTASTSTTTGAFQVVGGAGIGGALFGTSGNFTANSNSSATLAVVNNGSTTALPLATVLAPNQATNSSAGTGPYNAIGVATTTNNSAALQFLYVGAGSASNALQLGLFGNANILKFDGAGLMTVPSGSFTSTTDSSSTSTGSLQTLGGLGVAKTGWFGGDVNSVNLRPSANLIFSSSAPAVQSANGSMTFQASSGGILTLSGTVLGFSSTTDASSTSTGSLQTLGGLGVAKQAQIGTTLSVNGSTRVGHGAVSSAAWGLTGIAFDSSANTSFTDTTSSGTVATLAANSFTQPTVIANSATTYSDATNVYIGAGWNNGGNATFSRSWGLWSLFPVRVDSVLAVTSTNGSANAGIQFGAAASNGDAWLYRSAAGTLAMSATTASTSTTTGALVVSGGVGITGNTTTGGVLTSSQSLAANTGGDGLVLTNPAAATSGNQSYSPRVRWTGQGWKTVATAASQTVDWVAENRPVQAGTNPNTQLVFAFQKNAGGFTDFFTMDSGTLIGTFTGGFTAGGVVTVNGMSTSGNGNINLSGSSGTFSSPTGANTLGGAVTVNDATTPSITLASGKTNTGNVTVSGKTSGTFVITTADATAQAITLKAAAQTVGAGTLNVPDLAGTTDTVVTQALTQTLTNKTFDANATGNTMKWIEEVQLTHPDQVDGTGAVMNTTTTSATYGHATFSNSAAASGNYVLYRVKVPFDFDTATDLSASFTFRLSGADTNKHRYVISMADVAASASADSPTFSNAINLDFNADASGASGDQETVAYTTLTTWKSSLTAGDILVIKLARDGNNAQDTSTVDSTDVLLGLKWGHAQ